MRRRKEAASGVDLRLQRPAFWRLTLLPPRQDALRLAGFGDPGPAN